MVEEELAGHEEEGEVVQEPSECEESTDGIVFDHRGWLEAMLERIMIR